MAKRSFQAATWTPTATADGGTNFFANTTYMAIESGAAAQGLNVIEVECGGQATSSAVNIMQFARSVAFGTTPTALASPNSDGPLNGMTQTLGTVPITYVAASTGPARSSAATVAKLNLTFNAFGGIVRWQAAPGEEWGIIGVTSNLSGSVLGAFTGGSVGLMGAHIVYEPL
jgi:hypothetical protein